MEKVVIDTSVFISAFLSKEASPYRILKMLEKKKIVNFTSIEILNEIKRVLIDICVEYDISLSIARSFYDLIVKNSIIVAPSVRFNICRDPYDNKFLDVVYESKSKYLITLDKDLLDLGKERHLKCHKFFIMRPNDFLEVIKHAKSYC